MHQFTLMRHGTLQASEPDCFDKVGQCADKRRAVAKSTGQVTESLKTPSAIAENTNLVRAQRGFSLVEVSIVAAIVLLLAVIGIPAIGSYLVENKAPKVGEDIVRFITQAQVGSFDGTPTPYASMSTALAAQYLQDSTVITIRENAGAKRILHGLGNDGELTVAVHDGGAAFAIVLSKVSHAACPAIASVLQRVADKISLSPNGQSSTVLKDDGIAYSAVSAKARCGKGDVNTFTFVVS